MYVADGIKCPVTCGALDMLHGPTAPPEGGTNEQFLSTSFLENPRKLAVSGNQQHILLVYESSIKSMELV